MKRIYVGLIILSIFLVACGGNMTGEATKSLQLDKTLSSKIKGSMCTYDAGGNGICVTGYNYPTAECHSHAECPTNTCYDTDGDNIYTFGVVSGLENGTPYNVSDLCGANNVLRERLCDGNYYVTDFVDCEFGCANGKCNMNDTNTTTTTTIVTTTSTVTTTTFLNATCFDSDGGQVFNVSGFITGYNASGIFNISDSCWNGYLLSERYCNGNMGATVIHNCTNCTAGRCI